MAYAEKCLSEPDYEYTDKSGICLTAPIYFNASDWRSPNPIISNIHGKVVDKKGKPLKNLYVEIWNIDEKISSLKTDNKGEFYVKAPATLDVRFTLPNGQKEQQWLFYEYPPLRELIEDTYTISWANKYSDIKGSYMPWEAFNFDKIKDTLKEINWTIKPNGKIMLSEKINN